MLLLTKGLDASRLSTAVYKVRLRVVPLEVHRIQGRGLLERALSP